MISGVQRCRSGCSGSSSYIRKKTQTRKAGSPVNVRYRSRLVKEKWATVGMSKHPKYCNIRAWNCCEHFTWAQPRLPYKRSWTFYDWTVRSASSPRKGHVLPKKKKNHKLYGSKILNSSLSYYPFDCCSCHQWNIAQWLCISYKQIQSIFLVTWDSYRWIGECESCQAFRRQKYGGFKAIRLQQRLSLYWRVHCPHKVQGGIKHYLSIKNKIQFIWRHCSRSVECSSEGRF